MSISWELVGTSGFSVTVFYRLVSDNLIAMVVGRHWVGLGIVTLYLKTNFNQFRRFQPGTTYIDATAG